MLLIQSLVFSSNADNWWALCICQTCDRQILSILVTATMRRYTSIFMVPMISIGVDQSSIILLSTNPDTYIYTEHLDSTQNDENVKQMKPFLVKLTIVNASRFSVILFASLNTISSSTWAQVLKIV